MGCDGGTIPRRDELVVTKKKPEKKDRDSELFFRWRMCALSQTPLQEPIVACRLGKLYNKEVVIQKLLERSSGIKDDAISHIKNMKDIKLLNLTPNSSFKEQDADKGDAYIDRSVAPFVCPVVGLEMNGKFKFVVVWSCGCVLSEKSIKHMKTEVCHKCQKSYTDDDLVILNAVGEDLEALEKKVEEKRLASKNGKTKGEKRKEETAETAPVKKQKSDSSSSAPLSKLGPGQKSKKGEVYKSIFTSRDNENRHATDWITHRTF